jgi:hypothetical protein
VFFANPRHPRCDRERTRVVVGVGCRPIEFIVERVGVDVDVLDDNAVC